jgi:hypothetical protein
MVDVGTALDFGSLESDDVIGDTKVSLSDLEPNVTKARGY